MSSSDKCVDLGLFVKGCPLPTSQTDSVYKNAIDDVKDMDLSDEASFKDALKMLSEMKPSTAFKELRSKQVGGRRKRLLRKAMRGGQSKVMCHLKAIGIITALGGSAAASGYTLFYPAIAASIPKPCEGLADQATGWLMGTFVDPSYGCDARQRFFDRMIQDILKNFTAVTGVGLLATLKLGGSAAKRGYKQLLHILCPEQFPKISPEEFQGMARQEAQASREIAEPASPPRSRREEEEEYFTRAQSPEPAPYFESDYDEEYGERYREQPPVEEPVPVPSRRTRRRRGGKRVSKKSHSRKVAVARSQRKSQRKHMKKAGRRVMKHSRKMRR